MAARAGEHAAMCANPGCDQRFDDHERRITDLERSLRAQGGIFDTLKRLELELTRFVATVTASVRTATAVGSMIGAIAGGLFAAAVAVLLAKMKGG